MGGGLELEVDEEAGGGGAGGGGGGGCWAKAAQPEANNNAKTARGKELNCSFILSWLFLTIEKTHSHH